MSNIIFYNSYEIFVNPKNKSKLDSIPGGQNFSDYYKIFSYNISSHDRTGVIQGSIKTEALPICVMPELRPCPDLNQIIDERALFLMHKAKHTGRKLAIMYSGGVDSTVVLAAFVKNFSDKDIRENIVVLLSHDSISENPNFYYDYVIKKFNCISTFKFPYYLGHDDYIFLSGENADQLFGSQVADQYITMFPRTDLFKPVEDISGNFIEWLNIRIGNKTLAEKWCNLFDKHRKSAPIKINTFYEMLWWINFTCKWQSVYVRMLGYCKNPNTLKLEENYTSFFVSEDFQLWSLNNSDILLNNIDMPYKYHLKKYVIGVTKDESFMTKPKVGSLANAVRQKLAPMTIDSNMNFNYDYPDGTMFNMDNSFVDF